MYRTDPKSCPICENASIISGNHKCQDYYDNLAKTAVTTTTDMGATTIVMDAYPITPQPIIGKIDNLLQLWGMVPVQRGSAPPIEVVKMSLKSQETKALEMILDELRDIKQLLKER